VLSRRPALSERALVALAVLLTLVVRLTYIYLTRGQHLAGDEIEYDREARFAAHGHLLWTTTPYGIAHASTWKAPGYAAFLGVAYHLLGDQGDVVDRVLALQSVLFGPLAVLATWQLGRRLVSPRVGVVAAFVIGIYPNAWQFDVRLYSEVIGNPLTTAVLAIALPVAAGTRVLSRRAAGLLGLLLGVGMLVRPSSISLVPVLALACWGALGRVRGTATLAAVLALGVLVVAPWSVRNATLPGPWVPLSVQSAAGYGVFNDDAAHDAQHRWAWRPVPSRDLDLIRSPRTDGAFYAELNRRTADYIKAHPSSVVKAFWANGIRRLYELRPASEALDEVRFEGRTRSVTAVGLWSYYALALLALAGLWRFWRRGQRLLVIAVLALGLSSAVIFTSDGETRYRAPIEPLVVVLAVSAFAARTPEPVEPGH
jgi:hypothetical protein